MAFDPNTYIKQCPICRLWLPRDRFWQRQARCKVCSRKSRRADLRRQRAEGRLPDHWEGTRNRAKHAARPLAVDLTRAAWEAIQELCSQRNEEEGLLNEDGTLTYDDRLGDKDSTKQPSKDRADE